MSSRPASVHLVSPGKELPAEGLPESGGRIIAPEGAFRYELKYALPLSFMEEVRTITRPYVQHDRHCAEMPNEHYTVRSVYYDTDDLLFYFEKMDSVRIRKKLRVRTYNGPEDMAPAFLEIKRKYGRRGFKERVRLPITDIDNALNSKDAAEIVAGRSFKERKALDRFRFNMRTRHLRPVVLVTYEREAFVGRDNERVRVTFDQNIRSLINPTLEQIFEDVGLRVFEDELFVLELKFDGMMPRWMTQLIRLLNLRSHPYSKYCHGIDAWTPHPK